MVVKRRAFLEQVVGADDGGVTAGVAAADPALLEHGDVGQAVLLGEVVGRAQAVAAAADDDGVVAGLGAALRHCGSQLRWPDRPRLISAHRGK